MKSIDYSIRIPVTEEEKELFLKYCRKYKKSIATYIKERIENELKMILDEQSKMGGIMIKFDHPVFEHLMESDRYVQFYPSKDTYLELKYITKYTGLSLSKLCRWIILRKKK